MPLFLLFPFLPFLTTATPLLHLSLLTDNFRHLRHECAHSHIVNNSLPTPIWHPCVSTTSQPPSSTCYTHPPTAIRIFLFFTLHPPPDSLPQPLHPKLTSTTLTHTVSTPISQISDFFYRPQNARGAFSLLSPCLHATLPNQSATLTFTFHHQTISLSHACPSPHTALPFHISLSHTNLPHHQLSTSITVTLPTRLSAAVLTSLTALSHIPTALSVLLLDDASDVDFISPAAARHLSLSYSCLCYGPATIGVTLSATIPPFEAVSHAWDVQCGGERAPAGLFISTKPWEGDVVAHGRVLRPYNADGEGAVVSGGRVELYLVFMNVETRREQLRYAGVEIEGTGRAVVREEGGGLLRKGGVLRKGMQRKWIVWVGCRSRGKGSVVISVGFLGGFVARMKFVRWCGRWELIRRWWWWWVVAVGVVIGVKKINKKLGRRRVGMAERRKVGYVM